MSKFSTLTSAAVVLAVAAFADMPSKSQKSRNNPCACLEQGMGLPTDKKCFPAAYNAPAEVVVSCGWDFDLFASFIYWHSSQDNMDVAYLGTADVVPGTVAYQDFTYKPGFKVGFGFDTNYDDWTGFAEYTWLHQTTSGTATVPSGGTDWTGSSWYYYTSDGSLPTVASVSSSWKMNLDMVDVDFSRPYYEGTQITIAPYAGLRALWLRQRLNITYNVTTPFNVIAQSHSWSIGPNAGVMGHWLLGMGFRFEGKTAGSLLYTQYTNIGVKNTDPTLDGSPWLGGTSNYNCLRPMLEMGVGLGWGSYLYCQQYYIDFSARYDFNYLWDQNVMRNFASQLFGLGDQSGDLAIHGLTVSGRFDF